MPAIHEMTATMWKALSQRYMAAEISRPDRCQSINAGDPVTTAFAMIASAAAYGMPRFRGA
jgi:hypothetical protein